MRNCPTCNIEMVSGRRQDKADNYSVNLEAWLPNAPDDDALDWFSQTGEAIHVTTFACPKCGLLQSFIDPNHLSQKK